MHKINDFTAFAGQHCESTTTCNLLHAVGIDISEPMLFGLGEGLGFATFKFKSLPAPFWAGRCKSEHLTQNACKHLDIDVDFRTTTSKKKAWQNVAQFIEKDIPVGVKLDCYFLDYFTSDVHFAAHYLTVYGYDDQHIFVVDTNQQGACLKTDRENFELGRFHKGPMASKALTWTISSANPISDWRTPIIKAIHANSATYLTPPIKNLGFKGIIKASKGLEQWFTEIEEPEANLNQLAMFMERAGTGGALFRNFYRDFLLEAQDHIEHKALTQGHAQFVQAARMWTEVATLIEESARTSNPDHLLVASKCMQDISALEHEAMSTLQTLA